MGKMIASYYSEFTRRIDDFKVFRAMVTQFGISKSAWRSWWGRMYSVWIRSRRFGGERAYAALLDSQTMEMEAFEWR